MYIRGVTAPIVLVIDDEPPIRRAVRHALSPQVARVIEAGDARAGLDVAAAERPDAIILDLGLPDASGADVCRQLRAVTSAPIIVLSAHHTDGEKVALLDAGADDYVTKPFSTDELQARVRAQLRRAAMLPTATDAVVAIHGLVVDLERRTVQRDGAPIHLTRTEWSLLHVFLAHRGRPLTHAQLFRAVWNQPAGDPQQYLRVHVANLRRKLERDALRPQLIITEPGVGYRFTGGA